MLEDRSRMNWLQSFDPDPQWYVSTLHGITVVSVPIYVFGMICVIWVNTSSNKYYKYILAFNMTINYITQLSLSLGTIPVAVLPVPGGYPLGILSQIGVPTCFQLAGMLNLLAANGIMAILIFLYRNSVIMPLHNKIQYLFIAYLALIAIVVPLAINTALCQTTDRDKAKADFQKECPAFYLLLLSRVLNERLFILDSDTLLYFAVFYYICLIFQGILWIGLFVFRLTVLLRRQIFSASSISMHKAVVRCLLIQTTVYYGLFLIPLLAIIIAVYLKAALPTAANVAFVVISLSDPAGVLAMILSHRKYRTTVIRLLVKSRITFISENILAILEADPSARISTVK